MQKQFDAAVVRVHRRLVQKFHCAHNKAQAEMEEFMPNLLTKEQITAAELALGDQASRMVSEAFIGMLVAGALEQGMARQEP